MMARKKTRAQKIKDSGGKPSGNSRYALKIAKRRKEAIGLGLHPDSPYPLIGLSR